MAEKKVKTETEETKVINEDVDSLLDSDLDKKVTVINIADWDINFSRFDGTGTVSIPPHGSLRLTRNEIKAQIENGRRFFVGTDGLGSHATVFIDDIKTRKYFGFEEKGRPQMIFNDRLVKDLFDLPQKEYEKAIKEKIVTRAEEAALMEAITRLKLNDYAKIVFAEKFTGERA